MHEPPARNVVSSETTYKIVPAVLWHASEPQVRANLSADPAMVTCILHVTTRTVEGNVSTEDNQETDVLFKTLGDVVDCARQFRVREEVLTSGETTCATYIPRPPAA